MLKSSFRSFTNRIINKAERKLGRTSLISKPTVVDVVLTKACNLSCTFCRDYETEGAQRISIANFEQVVRLLLRSAARMDICSGGEPYLHTGLEQILRYAREQRVFTWVLSNGMLLPDKRLETILSEDLISLHGFSVDGVTSKTVESLRRRAKLPQILQNIDKLIRLRAQIGRTRPGIVIRYALMRRNIEELPPSVEYWGARGVNELSCNYLAIANGMDKGESLYFHQDLTAKVFDDARRTAERYPELKLNLPELISDQRKLQLQPRSCSAPWNFVMIDTNGNVLPCYRAFEAITMGNIYNDRVERFDEIWNCASYQHLRATVNRDTDRTGFGYCSKCEARLGWGTVEPHLGDETWLPLVNEGRSKPLSIDHSRQKRGGAEG